MITLYFLLWVAVVGGKIETEMFRAENAVVAAQMCQGLRKMELYYQKHEGKKKAKTLCQLWTLYNGVPLPMGDIE